MVRSRTLTRMAVDSGDRPIVAMALRTLAAANSLPPNAERESVLELAIDWQKFGVHATWLELLGTRLGVERDRLHELVGCVAATGEQLGLAWTADQDTQRWQTVQSDGQSMALRALADITAHFSLGAAHGVANATLRTLHLAPTASDVLARKRFAQYPAFSDDRGAWPTFGRRLLLALDEAAKATGAAAVVDLVATLTALLGDARYQRLDERRGMDYHRWRPQSLPNGGGVPKASLWDRSQPGVVSLAGGGSYPPDPLAIPGPVAAIATDGMMAVVDCMRAWEAAWTPALDAIGVKIFRSSG